MTQTVNQTRKAHLAGHSWLTVSCKLGDNVVDVCANWVTSVIMSQELGDKHMYVRR